MTLHTYMHTYIHRKCQLINSEETIKLEKSKFTKIIVIIEASIIYECKQAIG